MTLAIDIEREKLSRDLLGENYNELDEAERDVIDEMAREEPTVENVSETLDEQAGFWDRMADRVAAVGGSWSFIFGFSAVMAIWILLNVVLLKPFHIEFDPYPFIFLNLVLSTLAAIQAPVIMMSQNRQAKKDRAAAEHDYSVNLRAELEIMSLHDKVDAIREHRLHDLLVAQGKTLEQLTAQVSALHEKLAAG
ncbi:MAG TPA: DUF1003 domain-containing protein [Caulobacteraceae bacterium]|jgi:uncharacterized membrane protein|nr:DUF1003 domain-containing protein [Caulobacteraceae bacterium]